MTELAYMIREDWAQHGTAMVPQSAAIRRWVGEAPYLFAVADVGKFNADDRSADLEAAEFIAPNLSDRKVVNIGELRNLTPGNETRPHAIIVLHPYEQRELEAIRAAVAAGLVSRLFVLIWSPRDITRIWLDGLRALNLHTQEKVPAADPLMVAAAEMMVNEEYNGLSSGRGKDAVVQLVRAFAAKGYAVDTVAWLRAYFAAGGGFRHAESIEKLVKEMAAGTKHRTSARYREDIFEVIRERTEAASHV